MFTLEDVKTMNFSDALQILLFAKAGKIARAGWNGKGMWIQAQFPDADSKMTQPYVFMKTADDQLIPWLCSQADLFATDWEIVQ